MNNLEKHTENYNNLMNGENNEIVRVKDQSSDDKGHGAESVVFLQEISEETITQISQTPGYNLEIGRYIGKNTRVIYERYLGLTEDMNKIIKLGETLLMLFVLIRKCGESDCCVLNYATLAEACRVSVSTIKVWSNKLEQLGFINKQISGPNGVTFTLNDDAIGRSDLFHRLDWQLFQSAEQIRATMVVAQNAFKQALASIQFKTENTA